MPPRAPFRLARAGSGTKGRRSRQGGRRLRVPLCGLAAPATHGRRGSCPTEGGPAPPARGPRNVGTLVPDVGGADRTQWPYRNRRRKRSRKVEEILASRQPAGLAHDEGGGILGHRPVVRNSSHRTDEAPTIFESAGASPRPGGCGGHVRAASAPRPWWSAVPRSGGPAAGSATRSRRRSHPGTSAPSRTGRQRRGFSPCGRQQRPTMTRSSGSPLGVRRDTGPGDDRHDAGLGGH